MADLTAGDWTEIIGGGLQLYSGYQAGKEAEAANELSGEQKAALEREASSLSSIADPLQEFLQTGLAPGGDIRAAQKANVVAPAVKNLKLGEQAARSTAFRTGGADTGAAGRARQRRKVGEVVAEASGEQFSRLSANQSLGDMFLTLKGAESTFDPQPFFSSKAPYIAAAQTAGSMIADAGKSSDTVGSEPLVY